MYQNCQTVKNLGMSQVKAFLKTHDGVYPLAPKVTTIGSERCDFLIAHPSVDVQHALIEYVPHDASFILKDLESEQGTFVNEKRLTSGASVRLMVGDVLRFGSASAQYTLVVEAACEACSSGPVGRLSQEPPLAPIIPQVVESPIAGRSSCTQLPQISSPSVHPQHRLHHNHSLPAWNQPVGQVVQLPRPPPSTSRLDQRPPSASGPVMNKTLGHSSMSQASAPPICTCASPLPQQAADRPRSSSLSRRSTPNVDRDGVISSPTVAAGIPPLDMSRKSSSSSRRSSRSSKASTALPLQQQHQFSGANTPSPATFRLEENSPTPVPTFEQPSNNAPISPHHSASVASSASATAANRKIQKLKLKVRQLRAQLEAGQQVAQKLQDLQREVLERQSEVLNLRYQLHQFLNKPTEEKERVNSPPSLQREVEALKQEINHLKKEVEEKSSAISSIKSKNNAALESVEASLSQTHSQLTDSQQVASDLREVNQHLRGELEQSRAQVSEMESVERLLKLQLQEKEAQLLHLRNQLTTTLVGVPALKSEALQVSGDDQLVELVKQLAQGQISQQPVQVQPHPNLAMTLASFTKCLQEIRHQLFSSPEDSAVEHVRTLLNTFPSVEEEAAELLGSFREELVAFLQDSLNREEARKAEEKTLSQQQVVKEDRDLQFDQEEQEPPRAVAIQMAVDEAIKAAEERFVHQLEEVKASSENEVSKALENVTLEKGRVEELTVTITHLQEEVERRSHEIAELTAHVQLLQDDLQQTRAHLHESKETLLHMTTEKAEEDLNATVRCKKVEDDHAIEIDGYKEQVRQHAITICALGERINVLTKANEDFKEENRRLAKEVDTLQKVVADLELKQHQRAMRPIQDDFMASHRPDSTPFSGSPILALPPPSIAPPAVAVAVAAAAPAELAAMERSLIALRQENHQLKLSLREKEDCIKGLQKDLAGAAARLSDMRGELTDEQKEGLVVNEKRAMAAERDLMEAQTVIAKLSTLVEEGRAQIVAKDNEIKGLATILEQHKNHIQTIEKEMSSRDETSKVERENLSQALTKRRADQRITEDLASAGSQCRGEKHVQVIAHQKEAIMELRQKLRLLTASKQTLAPNAPDPTVQQVISLQREIAALRSELALRDTQKAVPNMSTLRDNIQRQQNAFDEGVFLPPETKSATERSRTSALLVAEKGASETRGSDRGSAPFKATSGSEAISAAHQDALEALQFAEANYLHFARSLAAALDLESTEGLTSFTSPSREERERVRGERERFHRVVMQRLTVMRDQLLRKDALLQGNEVDDARRRQAEELLGKMQAQLDDMIKEVRTKNEEIELLRETLNRTKEMLNQEKQINMATKNRKPLIVERPAENGNASKSAAHHQHCFPEDAQTSKEKQASKTMQEKIKRKDYEIRTLKQELSAREDELSKATLKLAALDAAGDTNS